MKYQNPGARTSRGADFNLPGTQGVDPRYGISGFCEYSIRGDETLHLKFNQFTSKGTLARMPVFKPPVTPVGS